MNRNGRFIVCETQEQNCISHRRQIGLGFGATGPPIVSPNRGQIVVPCNVPTQIAPWNHAKNPPRTWVLFSSALGLNTGQFPYKGLSFDELDAAIRRPLSRLVDVIACPPIASRLQPQLGCHCEDVR